MALMILPYTALEKDQVNVENLCLIEEAWIVRKHHSSMPLVFSVGLYVQRIISFTTYLNLMCEVHDCWTKTTFYDSCSLMCEADIRFVVRPLALCGFFENQTILKQRANGSEQHMGLIVDTEHRSAKGTSVERCSLYMTDLQMHFPIKVGCLCPTRILISGFFFYISIYAIFYFLNIIFWSFYESNASKSHSLVLVSSSAVWGPTSSVSFPRRQILTLREWDSKINHLCPESLTCTNMASPATKTKNSESAKYKVQSTKC